MLKTGSTITNGFSALAHHRPEYNTKGFQINYRPGKENGKILSNSIDIPTSWGTENSAKKTWSSIKMSRKLKPDPSYDLTGDGNVSAKEYLIAKYFDKNHDGVLDPEEKEECMKQLKNGFENKY